MTIPIKSGSYKTYNKETRSGINETKIEKNFIRKEEDNDNELIHVISHLIWDNIHDNEDTDNEDGHHKIEIDNNQSQTLEDDSLQKIYNDFKLYLHNIYDEFIQYENMNIYQHEIKNIFKVILHHFMWRMKRKRFYNYVEIGENIKKLKEIELFSVNDTIWNEIYHHLVSKTNQNKAWIHEIINEVKDIFIDLLHIVQNIANQSIMIANQSDLENELTNPIKRKLAIFVNKMDNKKHKREIFSTNNNSYEDFSGSIGLPCSDEVKNDSDNQTDEENHMPPKKKRKRGKYKKRNQSKPKQNTTKRKKTDPQAVLKRSLSIKGKSRPTLPKHAKKQMGDWFSQNFHHPYPSDEVKLEMAKQGGISINQVNHFFINKRSRVWRPLMNKLSSADIDEEENSFSIFSEVMKNVSDDNPFKKLSKK